MSESFIGFLSTGSHSVNYYVILYTVKKAFFVLAFHQKIPSPRIDNPAADTRKFFPPPIDLIHIPQGRKFFGSLEGDLLYSHMPEKSSGPWNETFYIPPCHKSLASGGRPSLALGTRISRHWGMQKASFQGPEESGRLFRHGDGKKQQQGHHAATFIMQQRQQQKSQQPQKH
jgi:hypothetical protein